MNVNSGHCCKKAFNDLWVRQVSDEVVTFTLASAATKGDRKFGHAVDGRLHDQLFRQSLMQDGIDKTSMSSRVLQRHSDLFLPVAEWLNECPLFRHKRASSKHRIDCLCTLPAWYRSAAVID